MKKNLLDYFILNANKPELLSIFFGGIILALFLSGIIFTKRKLVGRQSFLFLVSALLFTYLIVFLYSIQIIRESRIVLFALFLGGSASATSLLFFSLHYAGQQYWLKFSNILFFFLEPIFFTYVILNLPANAYTLGQIYPGPSSLFWAWDYIHNFYIIIILLAASVIIAPSIFLGIGTLRRKVIATLGAILVPIVPIGLGLGALFEPFSFQMFAFTLSGLILSLTLSESNSIDLMPFSRNRVVEQMREGWLLLDSKNRIVDANIYAEKILTFSKKEVYGKEANTIFSSWPNIINSLIDGKEADFKTSSNAYGEVLYLHIRISHIKDSMGLMIGWQILLRDYTERRIAELARQQARDEMFSLLHSISGAASRSENMTEFITASTFQLAYSFESQIIAIFLNDGETNDDLFLLVSHQGIKAEHIESLAFLDKKNKLVSQILKSRTSLLVGDIQTDARIPLFLRRVFVGRLLMIPIITDEEFVGFILLTREKKTYSNDEITRLEIAAEQIGAFVQNDRRRDIASTLAERQRLIRDLHDSVTQRLYALVMTTEAAQLGLKSGKLAQPGDIITKLGFHARQALREMRLFLHKLQPIDLARDGFAVVLLHRLEAVEGRAWLERELDIDEDIALGPEEELALFFIAQEALNNIIKHADASAIKVKFKKNRVNYRLEINDNGHGFNSKKVNRFGLGLKNMRTRAKQIGAKIRVSSSSENGTKIVVLIRHIKSKKGVGVK